MPLILAGAGSVEEVTHAQATLFNVTPDGMPQMIAVRKRDHFLRNFVVDV